MRVTKEAMEQVRVRVWMQACVGAGTPQNGTTNGALHRPKHARTTLSLSFALSLSHSLSLPLSLPSPGLPPPDRQGRRSTRHLSCALSLSLSCSLSLSLSALSLALSLSCSLSLPPSLSLSLHIAQVYHLPIDKAATALRIGMTTMKLYCRRYGVMRWPYRKLASIDSLMTVSCQLVVVGCLEGCRGVLTVQPAAARRDALAVPKWVGVWSVNCPVATL
jgi:hypothetical protein